MVGLIALYGKPADEGAFLAYYAHTHEPLAAKLPGVKAYRHGRVFGGDRETPSVWYAAHLTFADAEALRDALASPEGDATADDLPNFATGGVELLFVDYGRG